MNDDTEARAREIAAWLNTEDRSSVRALTCVGPYCFVGWDDDMHAHLRRIGLCTRHEHWANPTELCLAVARVLAERTVGQ